VRGLDQLALVVVVLDLVVREVVLHVGDRRAGVVVISGQGVGPVAVGLTVDRQGDLIGMLGRVGDVGGLCGGSDAEQGDAEHRSAEGEPRRSHPAMGNRHEYSFSV
jgi:hypothetical protein